MRGQSEEQQKNPLEEVRREEDRPPDEQCSAQTAHRGRCRWPRVPGEVVCGHHLSDKKRGCSASHERWKKGGKASKKHVEERITAQGGWEDLLTVRSPVLAIRTFAEFFSRVKCKLEAKPFHCVMIFSEEIRKGKTVLMVFRPPQGASLDQLLVDVVHCDAMLRVLSCLPSLVHVVTDSWAEAFTLYSNAISPRAVDALQAKYILDPFIRQQLRKSENATINRSENSPSSDEDDTCGRFISLLTAYDGAFFLFGDLAVQSTMFNSIMERYQQSVEIKRSARVCKAVLKIEEAFSLRGWRSSDKSVAVDIGASPGSWSAWLLRYLRRNADGDLKPTRPRVVAVDPGDLDSDVASMEGVTHLRIFCTQDNEQSMAEVSRAIHEEGNVEGVGVLVCDMNRHPVEAVSLLNALAGRAVLADGAQVLLTLKLPAVSEKTRQRLEEEALLGLTESFVDKRIDHLFGNTLHESTLTARFCSLTRESSSPPIIPQDAP